MVLPALILQKSSANSKAKDHCIKVEQRMKMWNDGKIATLVKEGKIIQQKLQSTKKKTVEDQAKVFAKLMMQGKVTAALKLLGEFDCGVHTINKDILNALQEKHPKPATIEKDTLLYGPINDIPANYFDHIDEIMVSKAASLTRGASGPSHLDADHYRHILTSKKYKTENKELREQIAALTRKIATEVLDPSLLEPYVASRLIPLDKNPGVRPIGVGEVLRRIAGKCIGWVLRKDIQEAAGPLQTATGLQSGAEAAIHCMREIFADSDTDAVILVDASNAFNSLNRMAALHNVRVICPQFSTVLINTYRHHSRMIIHNSVDILSLEGTTQGDNLAMAFYALGTTPLVNYLRLTSSRIKMVCLADDVTGAGKFQDLRKWWDTVVEFGAKLGYYVNQKKSWIIVKDSEKLDVGKEVFSNTGIQFTTEGKRHLGASIGSIDFRTKYTNDLVSTWCDEMMKLCVNLQRRNLMQLTLHSVTERYINISILCV